MTTLTCLFTCYDGTAAAAVVAFTNTISHFSRFDSPCVSVVVKGCGLCVDQGAGVVCGFCCCVVKLGLRLCSCLCVCFVCQVEVGLESVVFPFSLPVEFPLCSPPIRNLNNQLLYDVVSGLK